MSTNVIHLQTGQAVPPEACREPVGEAVREVSALIASNNDERRRLFSRLDELRSGHERLRRSRTRPVPPDPLRPLIFFSIEEAPGDSATADSRGGRR